MLVRDLVEFDGGNGGFIGESAVAKQVQQDTECCQRQSDTTHPGTKAETGAGDPAAPHIRRSPPR